MSPSLEGRKPPKGEFLLPNPQIQASIRLFVLRRNTLQRTSRVSTGFKSHPQSQLFAPQNQSLRRNARPYQVLLRSPAILRSLFEFSLAPKSPNQFRETQSNPDGNKLEICRRESPIIAK